MMESGKDALSDVESNSQDNVLTSKVSINASFNFNAPVEDAIINPYVDDDEVGFVLDVPDIP